MIHFPFDATRLEAHSVGKRGEEIRGMAEDGTTYKMKFAKELEAKVVPEWQQHYIQYRKLKKLLQPFKTTDAENPTQAWEAADTQFYSELRKEVDKVETFYLETVDRLQEYIRQWVYHAYKQQHKQQGGTATPGLTGWSKFFATSQSPQSPSQGSSLGQGDGGPPIPSPASLAAVADRLTTYAALNRLAIIKIIKKHWKLLSSTQHSGLIRTSKATETSILETLRTDRAFWTGQEAEALVEEARKIRWDSSRLRAKEAQTMVP
ncbi:hypothetical protein BJ684DRAFT_19896 [Piptocephalis cylindrospora]|uniref:SPX domain-containing protein n=1 Tax=Piptocephalis cylindrospora TaxID=1907219 RepID=A0A4P9Y407_9FUNG|nr:hypothetical protein BJ684DRAFT_19896 [Piptocephalis cylindrospora]|eukprot:RKP13635.1 hypothetical protein BJ684DRAFT_19896 [Piptocephalis cylindrospora]